MTERDDNLPPLNLSPEMEEVVHELAAERGESVEDIKLRARQLMGHLGIEA